MKIFYVSSEVVPFAKTGGLADVAGSLPKALLKLGHDVRVFMPRYKKIDPVKYKLKKLGDEFYEGTMPGSKVKIYFFEHEGFFGSRDELYQVKGVDYPDNLERFTAFCQAAIRLMEQLKWAPDVVHLNDWQTGLIAAYLKVQHRDDPFFSKTSVVYSIHNLGYLGTFPKEKILATGLGWDQFTPEKLEFWDQLALAKAGLVYADSIGTVSQTYAREIQTPEFGHGLDGLLRHRSQDVFGVVNGLDYDVWNPAKDTQLKKKYSTVSLAGKTANKLELQKTCGLSQQADIPVIGMISRLADQKGLDILAEVLDQIMHLNCQFVVLGTGDHKYHELLLNLKRKYPDHIGVNLGFDAMFAQLIYAGSDFFIMPSRYEPCGLGQLISFKYGTVPIVRQTGGLADTVHEFDPRTGHGDGFSFSEYSAQALLDAVKKALGAYEQKNTWNKLRKKVMRLNYSWTVSAKDYQHAYLQAVNKRTNRGTIRPTAN